MRPPRPLFESLESRQLLAANLVITSVTSRTSAIGVDRPITATLTISNKGTDVGLTANAEVFLVPQGQTLNTSSDRAFPAFRLKPVYGGSFRALTRTVTLKNVAAGKYSLVAVLLKPTDGTPDTTTAVTGATVTFVATPATNTLAARLAIPTPPATITRGTKLPVDLTLTNKTALNTKVPVSFFLSTDPTLSADDVALPTQTFSATFTANKAHIFNRTVIIPNSKKLHGSYFLIAQVNRGDTNPFLPLNVVAVTPTPIQIT